MKATTLTQATRRILIAAAVATAATLTAQAGTVVWNGNAGNGSLSDGANWDGGAAPVAGDTLDFSGVTSATALNADFGDDRIFQTAIIGSGVLTMAGDFHVNTLTNACKLAIPSGASLTVEGDMSMYEINSGTVLYSNEGTVWVKGKIDFRCASSHTTFWQYASVSSSTMPIRVGGLSYNGFTYSKYLTVNLCANSSIEQAGSWVIGSSGMSFKSARQINHTGFKASKGVTTLYSSADWTLNNSGKNNATEGDIAVKSAGALVIDTSDADNPSILRKITLKGRIIAASDAAANAVTVTGCGTLVVDTTGSSSYSDESIRHTKIEAGKTLAVTGTATLQINKGKKITGSGTVSLASGAKLLLPDASNTVSLPSLAPAAGSTIVVTNLTAGAPAIALTGSLTMPTEGNVTLKIGGETQLEDGIYTILSSANALPADVVDHLTLDASEVVSGDCSLYAKGGVLLLLVGIAEPGYGIWVGGTDDNLSTAANWLNDEAPRAGDTLNFKAAASGTTVNADYGDTRIFATVVFGSGVVTLTGRLDVNTLTNAYKLAVASGATLAISGDLVGYAANNTKPLLYSNEGTVTVGGKVRFRSNSLINRAVSTVCQYEVVSANTSPIITKGLAYDAQYQPDGSWYPDYLVANLGSMDNGPGKWVIGADGTSYPRSRVIDHSGFRVTGNQSVTLHSSADWVLDETYRHRGNDLYIANTASVTIDTTDWFDGMTPRTVTLKGFVNVTSSHATPLIITGCGTVVIDTAAGDGNDTNKINNVLAVTNGATLKVNAGKSIKGEGSISLAAGTILALESTARTFAKPDIIPVTLPETGKATIKIDGTRLGSDQDFTICSLSDLPVGYNVADHVTVTGTAINGRKCTVKTVEVTENENTVTKLVANISPVGLVLTFK